jgi:hypothetical protein
MVIVAVIVIIMITILREVLGSNGGACPLKEVLVQAKEYACPPRQVLVH